MKKTDGEIERFCTFCEYGTPMPVQNGEEDVVICQKRGPVKADFVCRKFVYDLLKRDPKRINDLPEMVRIDLDD